MAPLAVVCRVTLPPFSAVLMLVAAALSMIRSKGSSSQVPPLPLAAAVLTVAPEMLRWWPEVSTKPPSPPWAPPLAVMVPTTWVVWAMTLTEPPLPRSVAEASRVAPLSSRAEALSQVPTVTAPPPAVPAASSLAPSTTAMSLPSTVIAPPVSPACVPRASSVPATCTAPSVPPSRTIWPLAVPTERAWATPSRLITFLTMSRAAAAVSRTAPPSADRVPVLFTSALMSFPSAALTCFVTWSPTANLISLSPYRSTVKLLPAAIWTVPRRAWMMPEFSTPGATSPTSPASAAVMVPRLTTEAVSLALGMSKFSLPAMKLALVMPDVVAMIAPTFTCAPLPNRMPLGLVMMTVPLAESWPRMVLAPLPSTRFNACINWSAWTNTTFSPAAMLKLCQSITSLSEFWMTAISVGLLTTIWPLPSAMVPPCGRARAGWDGSVTTTLSAEQVSKAARNERKRGPMSTGAGAVPVASVRVVAAILALRQVLRRMRIMM